MKKPILFLSIFFLFTDCKEEKPQLNTNSIYGAWQLVEQSHYDIDHQLTQVINISDGEILVFYRNNSFYSSFYSMVVSTEPPLPVCINYPPITGHFRMSNDSIEFSFSCTEETYDDFIYTSGGKTYLIKDNHLFLSTAI